MDHTFAGKISTCLVNPIAGHETELVLEPTPLPKSIAVVGAGPAGLAAAITAAKRGHNVTLFERDRTIGGQLNMAKTIPGKEEFHGLVAWFEVMLAKHNVKTVLETWVHTTDLQGFDHVIVATGVLPRDPEIPGQDHPSVITYIDALKNGAPVGKNVVIIGAGGIGFDVAQRFSSELGESTTENLGHWLAEWGVTDPSAARSGLSEKGPQPTPHARNITLCQRKPTRPGKTLGKTTGWIHRATLKAKQVQMLSGVNYEAIDDQGLHISRGADHANPKIIPADTIILCAGQIPKNALATELNDLGIDCHVIGGADVATELDAKRAIDQGTRVSAKI